MSYEFSDGFKVRDQHALYFLTFTVVGWIDLFSRQIYRDIFIRNMEYCRTNKGLKVGAFVIMTNHAHVIWQTENNLMSNILRDFKSFCSKQIIAAINTENESRKEWLVHLFKFHANQTNSNKEFKIWQTGSHPKHIYSEEFMMSKISYVHKNPVRAGIVSNADEYIYSSASNYITGKGNNRN